MADMLDAVQDPPQGTLLRRHRRTRLDVYIVKIEIVFRLVFTNMLDLGLAADGVQVQVVLSGQGQQRIGNIDWCPRTRWQRG